MDAEFGPSVAVALKGSLEVQQHIIRLYRNRSLHDSYLWQLIERTHAKISTQTDNSLIYLQMSYVAGFYAVSITYATGGLIGRREVRHRLIKQDPYL